MCHSLRSVSCFMLSLHHTCPPLDRIRQEHLLVITVACDCTVTLWNAKRTQLMPLIARYACQPLLVWGMVNLSLRNLFSVPDYNGTGQARPGLIAKNIRCSFWVRMAMKKRQPGAFLWRSTIFIPFLKIYIWNRGWISDLQKVCTLALYWGLFCGEFLCSKAQWT